MRPLPRAFLPAFANALMFGLALAVAGGAGAIDSVPLPTPATMEPTIAVQFEPSSPAVGDPVVATLTPPMTRHAK